MQLFLGMKRMMILSFMTMTWTILCQSTERELQRHDGGESTQAYSSGGVGDNSIVIDVDEDIGVDTIGGDDQEEDEKQHSCCSYAHEGVYSDADTGTVTEQEQDLVEVSDTACLPRLSLNHQVIVTVKVKVKEIQNGGDVSEDELMEEDADVKEAVMMY